jgi:hypothetical protein
MRVHFGSITWEILLMRVINCVIKMHLALAPTSRMYKFQSSPMLQLVGEERGKGLNTIDS